MLLWSSQVNMAVFAVFLTLEATEILLCVGSFTNTIETLKVGGYVGIATAAAAWYASAAGVINGMGENRVLPVGGKMGLGRRAGSPMPRTSG
jgi:succinate-acetate transporter protein